MLFRIMIIKMHNLTEIVNWEMVAEAFNPRVQQRFITNVAKKEEHLNDAMQISVHEIKE